MLGKENHCNYFESGKANIFRGKKPWIILTVCAEAIEYVWVLRGRADVEQLDHWNSFSWWNVGRE